LLLCIKWTIFEEFQLVVEDVSERANGILKTNPLATKPDWSHCEVKAEEKPLNQLMHVMTKPYRYARRGEKRDESLLRPDNSLFHGRGFVAENVNGIEGKLMRREGFR
jgi:hypothetical protein